MVKPAERVAVPAANGYSQVAEQGASGRWRTANQGAAGVASQSSLLCYSETSRSVESSPPAIVLPSLSIQTSQNTPRYEESTVFHSEPS